MRKRFIQFLILTGSVFILAFSCKSSEKTLTAQQTDGKDSMAVYIHRNPCFGRCATYDAKIYLSGYVMYDGISNTNRQGIYEAQLNKNVINEIVAEAKRISYDAMPDSFYNAGIADFPSTITSVKINGKLKSVFNGAPEAPKALFEFEKFIDRVFENPDIKWRLIRRHGGDD